jgi:UDP-glucuronate 4-epimerase
LSLYAATKKANELMAHSYSHLFRIPTTGLRFFTVYGPWGRPDMALFLFTKAVIEGNPINLFNAGRMKRDFTYIDDVVEGIVRVMAKPASPNSSWRGDAPDSATSPAPYRLYNVGNHSPVELLRFVEIIEGHLGKKARRNLLPFQPGDMAETYADIGDLRNATGFSPSTSIEEGVRQFIDWYRAYYHV